MKQQIQCPYSEECQNISFEEFNNHHKEKHSKEQNLFDIKDDDYFMIDMDEHLKIISSFWLNPIDLNEDSGYENPVFIKWINEMTPWEILVFPNGLKKKEELEVTDEKNEKQVSVFIGTIQSIKRNVSIEIELKQNENSIKKKAKHLFLDDSSIPGFLHFCSSSLIDFNKPFQCIVSVKYIDS